MSYLDGKSGMSYLEAEEWKGPRRQKLQCQNFVAMLSHNLRGHFSATPPSPVCAMCYVLLSAHADRGLIGAWNSTL